MLGCLTPIILLVPFKAVSAEGSFAVYAIEIIGNRLTDRDFLLTEMQISVGMTVSEQDIVKARQQLESLGLFNRVEITSAVDRGRGVIRVEVSEPFYLYAYPIFHFDREESEKRYYGILLGHWNFRGRGERLRLAGWTGEISRGFALSLHDPWFRFKERFAFSFSSGWRQFNESFESGEISREVAAVSIGVRRRLHHRRSWVGTAIRWEEQAASNENWTVSGTGRDRIAAVTLSLVDDARDYTYYPTDGYWINIENESSRILDIKGFTNIQTVDLRFYEPVGFLVFAGRLWSQGSQGTLPHYRKVGLNDFLIRAGVDPELTGSMTASVSGELRLNLLPVRYFSLHLHQKVNSYLKNMKFSVEALTFADKGVVHYSENEADDRREFSAYGIGLQFQLPFIHVLHVTAGWRRGARLSDPSLKAAIGATF